MAGRGYTIFDTAVGRCGIAWGDLGIVGVQLPEAREIDTRRRLFHLYPEARELRPPVNVETAIEGIAMLLRGGVRDLSDVTLDMTGIPPSTSGSTQFARTIPRGETRTYAEVASALAGVGRDPFGGAGYRPQPLHDHRALPSRARGRTATPTRSRRMAASSPSAGCCRSRAPSPTASKTLFDVLLPVAPPRPQN